MILVAILIKLKSKYALPICMYLRYSELFVYLIFIFINNLQTAEKYIIEIKNEVMMK